MKGVYNRSKRPTRYCSIDKCGRIHYGRGFCHNHYKRDEAVRYGHPYFSENKIELLDDYAVVSLEDRKRKEVAKAIIDLDDVDMIRSFKWCMTDNGYAITNYYGTMIRMHVMVMCHVGIDHINCNRLDNRKSNLRPASYLENNRRSPKRQNRTGYRGVTAKKNRFIVRLNTGVQYVTIYGFNDPEEAGYVYDQIAMQVFGDFSLTNFEY